MITENDMKLYHSIRDKLDDSDSADDYYNESECITKKFPRIVEQNTKSYKNITLAERQ